MLGMSNLAHPTQYKMADFTTDAWQVLSKSASQWTANEHRTTPVAVGSMPLANPLL
jgi:hypothetical protein